MFYLLTYLLTYYDDMPWTYPLPYYRVFAADTLLYSVTLISDLWPWTYEMYHLWCDETLYQIWTQSSNPRRSYSDFNIWPNDLECRVTYFDRLLDNVRQFIRAWVTAFLCWYVMSHCDFDPLTLKVRGTWSVTWSKIVGNLSEIGWIIDDLSTSTARPQLRTPHCS